MRLKNKTTASGEITLTGYALNDFWAMAKNVKIDGVISDHARILAPNGSIIISGAISNGAFLWAQTVFVKTNALLGKGGIIYGDEISLHGSFAGPMTVHGKAVTISGVFAEDLTIVADQIALLSGTSVEGQLFYTSEQELVAGDGVAIKGGLHQKNLPAAPSQAAGPILQIWLFFGSLLTSILFVKIFPNFFAQAAGLITGGIWKCLLAGMITAGLLVTGAILTAVSVVGLPLAAVLAASCGLLGYLAKTAVALSLGARLLRRGHLRQPGFTALTLGLVLLYLATNLPGITGMMIWLAITTLGMGAIMLAMLSQTRWSRPFSPGPNLRSTQHVPPPLPANNHQP